jgi:hypothetical protein
MMASAVAQQPTVRASGPTESNDCDSGNTPAVGTRPVDDLYPTMPLKPAGMRHEPPVSVPSPSAAMPSATDTAAPADEPPGMRPVARSHAARGWP